MESLTSSSLCIEPNSSILIVWMIPREIFSWFYKKCCLIPVFVVKQKEEHRHLTCSLAPPHTHSKTNLITLGEDILINQSCFSFASYFTPLMAFFPVPPLPPSPGRGVGVVWILPTPRSSTRRSVTCAHRRQPLLRIGSSPNGDPFRMQNFEKFLIYFRRSER